MSADIYSVAATRTPAPDAVKRLVDRFDQDREVFLSSDCKERCSWHAKKPHAQESFQRHIAATDKAIDALLYELYGLTDDEVRVVEGTT